MNKTIFFCALFCLLLFSCKKEEKPYNEFFVDITEKGARIKTVNGFFGEYSPKYESMIFGVVPYIRGGFLCRIQYENRNYFSVYFSGDFNENNSCFIYANKIYSPDKESPVVFSDFSILFRGAKYKFSYVQDECFYSVKKNENNEVKIEVTHETPLDIQNKLKFD